MELGLGQPVAVRAQVEEAERIGGAQVSVRLLEGTGVGKLGDPLRRAHREVMAALGADPEVLGELVLAVVRAAARTGVRVVGGPFVGWVCEQFSPRVGLGLAGVATATGAVLLSTPLATALRRSRGDAARVVPVPVD